MPSRLLFVTGKLAEPALRRLLAELGPRAGFEPELAVLPITVVALASVDWIARHWPAVGGDVERIILPGLCSGDERQLADRIGKPVERGPKDMRDLPEFFGQQATRPPGYGAHDIEILAEINHVNRRTREEIVAQARRHRADGADVVDLGCEPGVTWTDLEDTIKALRDEGLRVSIDSFHVGEIARAARAGAELVLSVNHSNRAAARDWGCEVVAIPDFQEAGGRSQETENRSQGTGVRYQESEQQAVPDWWRHLEETMELLERDGVPFRVDPVIEPIGFGFAASLGRYLEVRRRHPDVAMMMGVGNLTELTDVDSAGVNVMLLGFCQELGIGSVLTTEVINWCRTCVRELDLARKLVHHAVTERVLPKHVEPNLLLLRDPKLRAHGVDTLRELAERIGDRNFRLFAEEGLLHVLNDKMNLHGTDPFELFAEMSRREAIDPAHAFYLGYELAKAVMALTLGKNYVQDQPLNWGFLTRPEGDQHGD